MPDRFPQAEASSAMPRQHPPVRHGRIGVLLLNLGTPDATGYWPMRRYLKEFLSDRRVIEVNRVVWWLVLNLIVLTTRPSKSGEAYKLIWNKERDELPLRTITRAQAEKIAGGLAKDPRIEVDWAMRYGNPSVKSRLEALRRGWDVSSCSRSIRNIRRRPPRPPATRLSTRSRRCAGSRRSAWSRPIMTIPPISKRWPARCAMGSAGLDFEPEVVLASFHGLPQAYFEKGDPYYCHCVKTTRLLREALGWPKQRLGSISMRDSGAPNGSSPIPPTLSRSWPRAASSGWPSSHRLRGGLIDAGGDGDPGARNLPRARRPALRRPALPQRVRSLHLGAFRIAACSWPWANFS